MPRSNLRLAVLPALSVFLLASCGDEGGLAARDGPETPAAVEVPEWAHVAPAQVEEARKHRVPVAFENDLGMRFVLIPAGTFLMGSPEDEEGRDDDETQHAVSITRPYYMQVTEVTNGQYRAFRSRHDSHDFGGRSLNGDGQPVVHVSWNDAMAFAEWLGGEESGRGYRLPTEAEWERACRAGTVTRFWWGDSISPERANYYDGEFASGRPSGADFRVTLPVASLPANPWGLHEVHGNVREWCADGFANGDYVPGPATDPLGPDVGWGHLTRGGAYGECPKGLRAAFRIGLQGDDSTRPYVGFRLVSPLPRHEK